MKVFCIMLLTVIFAASMITSCGQKQEIEKKAAVIKPSATINENSDTDTEEEATTEEAPSSDASAPTKDQAQSPAAELTATAPKAVEMAVVETPKQWPSEELDIANFDSGEKPNNLGGNFGAWNKDPSDPTQWCKESFDNIIRHGDKGFSMKLNYSVESPNPAYNGFWMMLPNFDASKYDDLTFWVKGDPKEGYTTVFKVELKNASKQVGRYYVSNVSDQWQKIIIPLSELRSLPDRSNLTELVIVFEDRMASNKKGTIYLDDFKFTKNK